ncbi:MAG TPA: D-2-hydroxyacid dehydrogenase [Caulobacteraceae bacterium]|jgi:phosphoglycerate dehydrogenase-like enzyme
MQALMTEAALGRVADRLKTVAPTLDIVTVDREGAYKRAGAPIDAAEVDPEVYWVSLDAYPAGMLPGLFGKVLQGTRGQWAQVFSAGLDNAAFKGVMAKGVRISKSSAQAIPIAEYVIAHAFSLLHPIDEAHEAQAQKAWRRLSFREIGHSKWLLVGLGTIGQEIARRLKPFGVHTTVVRRSTAADPLADVIAQQSDLPTLLPEADVVVLACPLTDETRNIADEAFFQALKPGSILVNIGRGQLVDEEALKAGLDRSQPAHAVLDVFHTEPLPQEAWFWTHPQVRVTAHTSNGGDGLMERGDVQFLENLRRFLAGEPLLNEAARSEVGL